MKKTIWTAVVVAVVALMGIAFAKPGNIINKQDEGIKIGALLSLTGKYASLGEDTKNGLELAREEFKKEGVLIDVIYEDAASDPKTGLAAATNLINSDKTPIIFASPGSSVNLAVVPKTENSKVIFIAASATPKLNTAGPYTFKILPDIDPEIQMMATYLPSKGLKTIGVLFDYTSDTLVYANSLAAKLFAANGIKIVSYGFDGKSSDYRTQISQIKKENPNAVYVLASEKSAGVMTKQIRELGLKQTIYGWSGIVGGEFFNGAGQSAEGVVVTDQPFSCNGTDVMKAYCSDYGKKYPNHTALPYGAHVYDVIKIIGNIVKAKPTLRGEALQQAVAAALTDKAYSGASGDLVFDENGNITKQVFEIRKADRGQFVKVDN